MVCLLIALATPAVAERLITTISTSRVLIGSQYVGSELVLFGAIERDGVSISRSGGYDLAITVRGPRSSIVVRERERLGPVWVNRSQRKFVEIPGYLALLTSRPLGEMVEDGMRTRLKLGFEALVAGNMGTTGETAADRDFQQALIRLKKSEGLFIERERGVVPLSPNLFRAAISLPATAPLGGYDVTVTLLSGGLPLTSETTPFEVSKVGFEAETAAAARNYPLVYAAVVIAMALGSGWLATVIFRRD